MITTTIKVERRSRTRYSRRFPRGSGYCEEQGEEQALVKRWKWRGITIWRRVLDREAVPNWASIQMGALGFTTWRSKFAEYI